MSKIPRDAMKKSFVDKLVHDALVSWSYIKLAISFIKGRFTAKIRYIVCLVSVTFFLLNLQLVACGPTASPSPASSNAAVTTAAATSGTSSTATATSGTGSTGATGAATSGTGSTGVTAAATSGTDSTGVTAAATSGTGSTGTKTPIPPPDPKDYTISVEGGQVPASAYPGEPGFTAFTITVTNTRSYSITWSVISDSSWLSLDRHGDTLKPGASEDRSVKITALKNLQPEKTYTGRLQFSPFDSHTDGLKHYSEVDLTVNSPPASTAAPTSAPTVAPTPTSQEPVAPPTPTSQPAAPPTPTSQQPVAPPTPTSQPIAPPTPTSQPVAPPTSTST